MLDVLDQTNSLFLINLRPYDVYRAKHEIPIRFGLFWETPFNFRNLFDAMVDAVKVCEMVHRRHQPIFDPAFLHWISRDSPKCPLHFVDLGFRNSKY
ncbi:hypothetical protein RHSIM_Rhsim04G0169100 [Rhododendron simsii]|uniref:Uncharacterized protein n=1 Tax=Rhododendron simsii TaxID=118357 RepID=A0A834LRQ0_RHOSS|nr:hypothetical protein RHSIM_Rhsim04G0169100 [Rhododendron simsii]